MAFYGGYPGFAPAAPQFSPYAFHGGVAPNYSPYAATVNPNFGGWQLPPELQPLQFRQPSSAQQVFAGFPHAHYFGAQVPAGGPIAPGPVPTGFGGFHGAGFGAAPTFAAAPQGTISAAPFAAPIVPSVGPVDIYASTASAASHLSSHSVAHSVVSQGSVISAPSTFGQAALAVRRRNTSYGKWKDSQSVAGRIPTMRQTMPDPLQPPKRTSFRKWKDIQTEYARRGLI